MQADGRAGVTSVRCGPFCTPVSVAPYPSRHCTSQLVRAPSHPISSRAAHEQAAAPREVKREMRTSGIGCRGDGGKGFIRIPSFVYIYMASAVPGNDHEVTPTPALPLRPVFARPCSAPRLRLPSTPSYSWPHVSSLSSHSTAHAIATAVKEPRRQPRALRAVLGPCTHVPDGRACLWLS
ncbi:hypothetical protein B0H14DRAFT_462976 [Mycena olivaceomarginata]|nr:hypothetical protein B0H14DRAFT_462976 [Mycena olivaceomarginata]